MLLGSVFLFIFRTEIKQLIIRLTKFSFRRGKTHFEFEQGPPAELDISPKEQAEPEASDRPELPAPDSDIADPGEDETAKSFLDLIRMGRMDEAEEAYRTALEEAEDPAKKHSLEGIYLATTFLHGRDQEALSKLDRLSTGGEAEGTYALWLGFCLSHVREYENAAAAYIKAASSADSDSDKAARWSLAARALERAGHEAEAQALLLRRLAEIADPAALSELYKALSDLLRDDPELRALALEKAVEFNPGDKDLRFEAAYAYSSVDWKHPLGVHHYLNDLAVDPDNQWSLNNLGVAYENLDISMKSVELYRQAVEKGNTLGAANLAYRFMNAGFGDEAEALLTEARAEAEPHENVSRAIGSLARLRSVEEETVKQVMAEARHRQPFMRRYAGARFGSQADHAAEFEGKWAKPDQSELVIVRDGSTIAAEWIHLEKKFKLSGVVAGRSAKLDFFKMTYYSYDGSEKGFEKDATGYAFVHTDGHTLSVMEIREGKAAVYDLAKT